MSERVEIGRVENVYRDGVVREVVTCPGCGRGVGLWFNGGELDERRCECGVVAAGEHVRIDIVFTERSPDA